MKKILSGTLVLIFLASCQKEIDWGTGGGSDEKLVKVVQKTGTDSVTILYTYDASGRLIIEKTSGISQGVDADNELKIVRNSSGIIQYTVQKAAALVQVGIDSVLTRYNYNTGSGRYTSSVFSISLLGFTLNDSTVFNYDASGKMDKDEHYQSFLGLPYELSLKTEYTYNGANVSSQKQSSWDATTSSYMLIATINYTPDAKVNPLKLNTEGMVLLRPALFNANNVTQMELLDATDPTNNFTDTYVYTYSSSNKPLTAVSTQTPGGTVSNITYFYQ